VAAIDDVRAASVDREVDPAACFDVAAALQPVLIAIAASIPRSEA
jgi:hypothetical protein